MPLHFLFSYLFFPHKLYMSTSLSTLRGLSFEDLVSFVQDTELQIDNAGTLSKAELIFHIVCAQATEENLPVDGVLEILSDGFGFLRSIASEYASGADDIYVSPSQIRRFNLQTGDWIEGIARAPRNDSERYLALLRIEKINNASPEHEKKRMLFEYQTVVDRESKQENVVEGTEILAKYMTQMGVASIVQGSRVLLLLKAYQNPSQIVCSLATELQSDRILVIALNHAVEDVTWLRKSLRVDPTKSPKVFASLRGEGASRHIQLLDLAMHRAKRLAERGKNVHVLLSSLNEIAWSHPNGGSNKENHASSIEAVQKYVSLARSLQKGGSLTLWAIAHEQRSELEKMMLHRICGEVEYTAEVLPITVGTKTELSFGSYSEFTR